MKLSDCKSEPNEHTVVQLSLKNNDFLHKHSEQAAEQQLNTSHWDLNAMFWLDVSGCFKQKRNVWDISWQFSDITLWGETGRETMKNRIKSIQLQTHPSLCDDMKEVSKLKLQTWRVRTDRDDVSSSCWTRRSFTSISSGSNAPTAVSFCCFWNKKLKKNPMNQFDNEKQSETIKQSE